MKENKAREEHLGLVDIEMDKVVKEVTFRIYRYSGKPGDKPRFKDYKVPVMRGMTVLDALIWIRENLDGTLAFRRSCRMGVCGTCAIVVNGVPRLACQTQVLELNSDVVKLEPLYNFKVIKDLVVDLKPLFEKHASIEPYVIRKDEEEQQNPRGEYLQTPEEYLEYFQFSACIKCGLCLAACPTVATDPLFLGPQALAQAYRYSVDTRDEGFDLRCDIVDNSHGVWRCHYAAACTEVCPKGVDPALAIQLLKRKVISKRFGAKKKKVAPVGEKITKATKRPGIPEPPERTVKGG